MESETNLLSNSIAICYYLCSSWVCIKNNTEKEKCWCILFFWITVEFTFEDQKAQDFSQYQGAQSITVLQVKD